MMGQNVVICNGIKKKGTKTVDNDKKRTNERGW